MSEPTYEFSHNLSRCVNARSERAWEVFWCRERSWLRRVLERVFRELSWRAQPSDLDDLEQEVYLRVLACVARGRQRFTRRGEARGRAYLIRVAESVVVDHLRRVGALKRQGTGAGTVDRVALETLGAPGVDPETWTLMREQLRRVLGSCRSVAGRRRRRAKVRALALVLFGGYASGEAAARAGAPVSVSCIDTMVSRARQRLRLEGIDLPRRRSCLAELPRAA